MMLFLTFQECCSGCCTVATLPLERVLDLTERAPRTIA